MSPPTDTVLPTLLASRAASHPDRPFVVDAETGGQWTYGQADEDARRWSRALRRAGITADDTVVTMVPPCTEAVAAWLGAARLRAIEVPVNTAYVAGLLRYVIEDSRADLMIVHRVHLDTVLEAIAAAPTLTTIVVVGADGNLPPAPMDLVRVEDFLGAAEGDDDPGGEVPTARDIAAIIYTSGTTGPSKGVLVTWRQAELTATGIMPREMFDHSDAFYSGFPLFHMSGKGPLYACALVGARVVMRERFMTSVFWDDVRRHGATTTILLGAMANFLYQQPARPDDADTPLRDALFLPLIADLDGFRDRFGVTARTTFNMTETSCCILSDGDDLVDRSGCGRVRPGFQARVVDGDDVEVGPGEVGELVLRGEEPWTLMAGYWHKPEATVDAWRNLWFHTGDAFTRDRDGNFFFVDRIKDAIRRRGENISSFEVESEVNGHPDVLESAAVAVDSDDGEDELKVVVVLHPGRTLRPADLAAFLGLRLARFMVPRYIEFCEALPKTPTEKVKKAELRAAGITDRTWDRTASDTPGTRGARAR